MAIETDITKLVFNKMSQEKYEELKANGELVNNEFYITPDSNIDIDIPENVVEADNYVNAKLWKGTLAEYEALESYDDSVTYIITDDVVEGGTIVSVDAYTKSETDEFLNAKQDVLVSGTNIKTINGESILGEGDYVIDVDTSEIENNINTLNNELTTVKTDLNNKLDTTQITNCITEIPQDIKLELADGTLTLKAGSKVYVPNGFETDGTTPKFDEVVIENDYSVSNGGASGNKIAFWRSEAKSWAGIKKDLCYSSATEPETGKYQIWYDITNNSIYRDFEFTGEWIRDDKISLPFASFTTGNESVISSIDQVFNGFGYIGSTIFALPGVKGLIPNGRNEDGTYKSTVRTAPSVIVHTINSAWGNVGAMKSLWWHTALTVQPVNRFTSNKQLSGQAITFSYVESQNMWSETGDNGTTWVDYRQFIPIVDINFDGSTITSLTPKFPFKAVDYSDKPEISGWGMPSDRYIDLTLGASGTTYTAPANGWVGVRKKATASGQYMSVGLNISNFNSSSYATASGQSVSVITPVSKNAKIYVAYSLEGETLSFKFYYAEGEN